MRPTANRSRGRSGLDGGLLLRAQRAGRRGVLGHGSERAAAVAERPWWCVSP
jgi:hypothetical protein